jgi:hypothetical protein
MKTSALWLLVVMTAILLAPPASAAPQLIAVGVDGPYLLSSTFVDCVYDRAANTHVSVYLNRGEYKPWYEDTAGVRHYLGAFIATTPSIVGGAGPC